VLIKLIYPRISLRPMDSEFKRRMSPSLSLLVVAALTPPGHRVTVADENTSRQSFDDSPDIVGITVNVDTAKRAYEIAAGYRSRGIRVVLGGLHASACPEEAMQHADSVCVGEAEHVWPQMVEDAAGNCLKPRYQCQEPADVARTPIPRWELVDRSSYLYTNIMTASRGCPFQCEFCYNSCSYVHKVFRNRPVENVIAEIRSLNCRQVMFIDDNFIGNIEGARRLVAAMKPLDLVWHAAVSANIGKHPDLMDEMAGSGCRSLFIGIESVNGDSLRSARKHQNDAADYDSLIRAIHDRGMMVNASMVFGFDHDRPDIFSKSLSWLVGNKVESLTAHILTPYPGTALFRRLEAEGRITDRDWRHYNTSNVVFQPSHMTAKELRDGYLRLYDEFYSLANIIRRLPDDPSRRIPYLLFNFGYRKYGKVASLLARLGLMSAFGRAARRLAYGI
jgi:radical SAM superfamily enzyme YgiQ (UPF0313 family)